MTAARAAALPVLPWPGKAFIHGLVLLGLALMATPAPAVKEPRHEVLRALSDRVELRRYAPYVVAEVVLDASAADAGSQAFPILAGYIFGKN